MYATLLQQASVDNGDFEEDRSTSLIKEVLALVGPERGLEFEIGRLKFKVPPVLKANPLPDKGSWRRSGAAPATTKAPYKHRAAKREAAGAKPALPSASPHSPDCQ